MLRWVFVLSLAASPAVAQSIVCRHVGDATLCDQSPNLGAAPMPPVNYSAQFAPIPPVDAGLRAYEDARNRSRQALVDQVAPLMAAGQCETARLLAVRQRDAELADIIATTCKPSR